METIYEQIGRVRSQLVDEANHLVEEACATLTGNLLEPAWSSARPPPPREQWAESP